MKPEDQVSIPTGQDTSQKTKNQPSALTIKKAVKQDPPPVKRLAKKTKREFADMKKKELSGKKLLPMNQIVTLTDSFVVAVDEGLAEATYETIWQKYFNNG